MEIKNEKFYVDKILLHYSNYERHMDKFEQKDITANLLEIIKGYINDNTIERIELENTKENISMTVFYENGLSHIGIIDMYNGVVYYYNNNSCDKELIAIAGNLFQSYMICKDNNMLCTILNFFAMYGKRYPEIKWIEE